MAQIGGEGFLQTETRIAVQDLVIRAQRGEPIALQDIQDLSRFMSPEQYQYLLANVKWEQVTLPNPPSVFKPIGAPSRVGGGGGGAGGGVRRERTTHNDFHLSLASQGFTDINFDIDDYINSAVKGQKSVNWLIGKVSGDKRFRTYYSGIFDDNGLLRMSPAQYRQVTQSYRSIAANFGFNLNRSQVGRLVAGDVSPDEFTSRARAVQTIKTNPGVRKFLQEYTGTTNLKKATEFILGKSDAAVDQAYESASLSATAKSLGLSYSKANSRALAGRTEGSLALEDVEERFGRIAQQLRLGDVELRAVGLSQRELEIIQFGGPKRAAIAEKAERALAQRQAALQGSLAQQRTGIDRATGRPVSGTPAEAGY